LRLSLIIRTLMGGSWVEMDDDRKPARIPSKNPFPVKNAEFETQPARTRT
jgi:hypothetical protein